MLLERVSTEKFRQSLDLALPVSHKWVFTPLTLGSAAFPHRVDVRHCEFDKEVDFSNCVFEKGFEFVGCVFWGGVKFSAAQAKKDSGFRACYFNAEARFERMTICGKLDVRAPEDRTRLQGNRWYKIRTLIHPYVIFRKHVNFSQVVVGGEANFGSAQFLNGVDFYNARIEGPALFRKDFCRKFRQAETAKEKELGFSDREFLRTRFVISDRKEAAKDILDEPLGARFRDAYFGGELNFHEAIFHCKADFSYARCQRIVFFCHPLKPDQTGNPGYGHVCDLQYEVSFDGARFRSSLRLDNAQYSREHEVSFKDCRVAETLALVPPPAKLCMTGCTYERIEPADDGDIPKLMASLKSYDEEKKAFDLGAWTQLERTIRSSGKLEWADDVYRERMWQDRRFRAAWKKRLWLWGYVTGFGTRKWQLAVMCPVVLVIGTLTYFLGGLELDPRVANANNNYTKGLECRCRSGGLERFEVSLEVSTREFFPLSLPLAEECVPEFPLQKWTAMLQRVLGWILIPLLAASFTGILNRKAKTEPESSGDGE